MPSSVPVEAEAAWLEGPEDPVPEDHTAEDHVVLELFESFSRQTMGL